MSSNLQALWTEEEQVDLAVRNAFANISTGTTKLVGEFIAKLKDDHAKQIENLNKELDNGTCSKCRNDFTVVDAKEHMEYRQRASDSIDVLVKESNQFRSELIEATSKHKEEMKVASERERMAQDMILSSAHEIELYRKKLVELEETIRNMDRDEVDHVYELDEMSKKLDLLREELNEQNHREISLNCDIGIRDQKIAKLERDLVEKDEMIEHAVGGFTEIRKKLTLAEQDHMFYRSRIERMNKKTHELEALAEGQGMLIAASFRQEQELVNRNAKLEADLEHLRAENRALIKEKFQVVKPQVVIDLVKEMPPPAPKERIQIPRIQSRAEEVCPEMRAKRTRLTSLIRADNTYKSIAGRRLLPPDPEPIKPRGISGKRLREEKEKPTKFVAKTARMKPSSYVHKK